MKFGLAKNSIFAVLLRSPWWVSAVVAVLLLGLALTILPRHYAGFGVFAVLPFAGISVVTGWRERRTPSAAQLTQMVTTVSAMSWSEFSAVLAQGFKNDGCEVLVLSGNPIDFELRRTGKVALVCAKRWKAAHIGVAALQDLHAAQQARHAHESLYVALGEFSEAAQKFANEHAIRLVQAPELMRLLPPSLIKQ